MEQVSYVCVCVCGRWCGGTLTICVRDTCICTYLCVCGGGGGAGVFTYVYGKTPLHICEGSGSVMICRRGRGAGGGAGGLRTARARGHLYIYVRRAFVGFCGVRDGGKAFLLTCMTKHLHISVRGTCVIIFLCAMGAAHF